MIQFFLWSAAYSSKKTEIFGYSYLQIIAYSILASLVSKLTAAGFEYEMSEDIKNGGLNKFIVQPIGYFFYRMCRFFGQKLVQMMIIFMVILGVVVFFGISSGSKIEPIRVLIFTFSIVLALMLNFLIYFSLSTIAFWMEEVWGIFVTFGLIANIAGGGIFPLDIFGIKIQMILGWLPFQYIIFYPVNILIGKFGSGLIFQCFAFQLLWISIFLLFSFIMWSRGLKKYVAIGG